MRSAVKATTIYSVTHFFIDFACAFWFFLCISKGENWMLYIFLYNFCAFACQMPIGALADALRHNWAFAILGVFLIAIAPAVSTVPIALCIVLGIGNALFHVGGGRDVLCRTSGYGALGVFVSPGAIGLYLGTMLGKSFSVGTDINVVAAIAFMLVGMSVVLALLGVLIFFVCRSRESLSPPAAAHGHTLLPLICAAALFVVVALRSYVGVTLTFPWKEGVWVTVLVLALASGKAAGGFLADRFGAVRVTLVTLLLSAALFFFWQIPVCGVLAVFLFNMTMPITLRAICNIFPDYKGFCFGLLTLGLFVGIVPMMLGADTALTLPFGFAAACVISAALLWLGLRGAKRGD